MKIRMCVMYSFSPEFLNSVKVCCASFKLPGVGTPLFIFVSMGDSVVRHTYLTPCGRRAVSA